MKPLFNDNNKDVSDTKRGKSPGPTASNNLSGQPCLYPYASPFLYGYVYTAPVVPTALPPAQNRQYSQLKSETTSESLPKPLFTLPGGTPPWRSTSDSKNTKIQMSLPPNPVIPPKEPTNRIRSQAWPPSLKSFVERCFSMCNNDLERDLMESTLRERIEEAIKKNTLNAINWSIECIPNVFNGSNVGMRISPVKEVAPSIRLGDTNNHIDNSKKEARAKRFLKDSDKDLRKESIKKKIVEQTDNYSEDSISLERPIVGTSLNIEKSYLRLTSAPDPSTVRPLRVLVESLESILSKGSTKNDYNYLCDQLKSIRQDLTVQNIKSDFTVRVYEIHARMAIKFSDFGEYNQCQAQLMSLYSLGYSGHEAEFTSYRLLFLMITENHVDFNYEFSRLNVGLRCEDEVTRALSLNHCLRVYNYPEFFQNVSLLNDFGKHILKPILTRVRANMLGILGQNMKSPISLVKITSILGFDTLDESIEFLKSVDSCKVVEDRIEFSVLKV